MFQLNRAIGFKDGVRITELWRQILQNFNCGSANPTALILNPSLCSIEAIAKASKEYSLENTELSVEKAETITKVLQRSKVLSLSQNQMTFRLQPQKEFRTGLNLIFSMHILYIFHYLFFIIDTESKLFTENKNFATVISVAVFRFHCIQAICSISVHIIYFLSNFSRIEH